MFEFSDIFFVLGFDCGLSQTRLHCHSIHALSKHMLAMHSDYYQATDFRKVCTLWGTRAFVFIFKRHVLIRTHFFVLGFDCRTVGNTQFISTSSSQPEEVSEMPHGGRRKMIGLSLGTFQHTSNLRLLPFCPAVCVLCSGSMPALKLHVISSTKNMVQS